MALATYTTLVAAKATAGSIRHWLNADAVPVGTILSDAQAEIWRRLRVRQMLKLGTGSMSVGSAALTLPADYIAARAINYSGTEADRPLLRLQPEEIEAGLRYDAAGTPVRAKPRAFYVLPDVVQLNCPADAAYAYRMLYFAEPAELSDANPANFLTQRCPRLLRAMCMAYGNEWLKNPAEREWWLRVAAEMVDALNTEADFEMRNAELIVRPE